MCWLIWGTFLSPAPSLWMEHTHPEPPTRGPVGDVPAPWQLPLLSRLRMSETTTGQVPTLLFSWEKGEERFPETPRTTLTPWLGRRRPEVEISDKMGSETKVQSGIISAVIANLSLSPRLPPLIYCHISSCVTHGRWKPSRFYQLLSRTRVHMAWPKDGFVPQQNFSLPMQGSMRSRQECLFKTLQLGQFYFQA